MRNRKKIISILALIMALVMVLSLILSLIPHAHAASSSEIRNQINDLKNQQSSIRDQMEDLQAQYQETENEIVNLVSRKNIIDQEVFLLIAQIDNINEQISSFRLLIADKQDELNEARDRYDALSDEHRERIRTMEEEGGLSYWAVLFKASSFSDLLDRINMIQEIAASDRRRLQELNEAAKLVEEAQDALEAEKDDLEDTRKELDDAYAELESKQQEAQAMLSELLARSDELAELYEGFEMEEEDLMAEIARKEQEYNDARYREWLEYIATATTATTAPPETTQPPTTAPAQPTEAPTQPSEGTEPANPTEPTQNTEPPVTEPPVTEPPETEPAPTEPPAVTWILPCYYTLLTSPFGNRESPTEGASSYHQGVDLAGPEGTPIYATRSGTVTIAKYSNSAGYYVTINHGDGYSSVYMHMTNYVVSVGQTVSQGQLIGYMGSTGISTGPHLHFGIALNGVYVNPALYVPLY